MDRPHERPATGQAALILGALLTITIASIAATLAAHAPPAPPKPAPQPA